MSEESLLADVESTPNEETVTEGAQAETEVSPWAYAEGINGDGDKPEWFIDSKYKSVADQAKAYPELASKLGGFTGAPEEYELSMPDGIEGEWATDDPMLSNFQEWAKESGLNQDRFTELLHMYVQNDFENQSQNREQEVKSLGDNAKERLQNIDDYARANLSEDEYAGILQATTTAAGVKAVEALIAKTRGYKIPDANDAVDTGLSHSDLRQKMADPRYGSDPSYRKEVDALYERKFGKEPQRQTIG